MDKTPSHAEIVALIGKRAYGRVMSNLTRPIYVEGLVSLLLGGRWKYLGDWDGWDLERDDGKRLEVKQSAARQPWTDRPGRDGCATVASFDIAPRKGYWADGGKRWVRKAGRHADLFVFAHHPILDVDECDQRDAMQWRFYVLASGQLPATQKRIGINPLVKKLKAKEATHMSLATVVSAALR
jgi:hypothetical protein